MAEANLGLATTEEMMRELICRFTISTSPHDLERPTKVSRALTLAEMLGSMSSYEREYRTVNHG